MTIIKNSLLRKKRGTIKHNWSSDRTSVVMDTSPPTFSSKTTKKISRFRTVFREKQYTRFIDCDLLISLLESKFPNGLECRNDTLSGEGLIHRVKKMRRIDGTVNSTDFGRWITDTCRDHKNNINLNVVNILRLVKSAAKPYKGNCHKKYCTDIDSNYLKGHTYKPYQPRVIEKKPEAQIIVEKKGFIKRLFGRC